MNHTASASFFRIGTSVPTSVASLTANKIIPVEGAIIHRKVTMHEGTNEAPAKIKEVKKV